MQIRSSNSSSSRAAISHTDPAPVVTVAAPQNLQHVPCGTPRQLAALFTPNWTGLFTPRGPAASGLIYLPLKLQQPIATKTSIQILAKGCS